MSIKIRVIAPAVLALGSAAGIAAPAVIAAVAPAATTAVVAQAPRTHYAG